MTEAETAEAIMLCQRIEDRLDRIHATIGEIHVIFDRIDKHMEAFELARRTWH